MRTRYLNGELLIDEDVLDQSGAPRVYRATLDGVHLDEALFEALEWDKDWDYDKKRRVHIIIDVYEEGD